MKCKITLISLGLISHLVDIKKISKRKSDVFEIVSEESIDYLYPGEIEDDKLDIKYIKDDLRDKVNCKNGSDVAIGIMPYRFCDNFYMHTVNDRSFVISLYGISDILLNNNISIENFILKQLYEVSAFKLLHGLPKFDGVVYDLVHRDTRGCLFDMNGEISNIILNTEHPKICDACKSSIREKQIDSKMIAIFEKELKSIDKSWIQKYELFIKRHPFVAISISVGSTIAIGFLGNLIFYIAIKAFC